MFTFLQINSLFSLYHVVLNNAIGHVNVVGQLLAKEGINVDQQNNSGHTSLQVLLPKLFCDHELIS